MRNRILAIYASWPAALALLLLLGYLAWELLRAGRGAAAVVPLLVLPIFYTALRRLQRTRSRLERAEGNLTDRSTELETLHAISREIMASSRPERIFATLDRECRKIFEFDCAWIALAEPNGELLTAYRHQRRRATEFGRGLPVEGLAHWARAAKRGQRVDDLRDLPDSSPLRGKWTEPEIRSLLAIPLVIEEEVIGVLSLQSERIGAYDDHQLALLTTIAQQVAIAIESARRQERATLDSLTGLFMRDYFFTRLAQEDDRARRYGGGFAVLMVDLDDFKRINDEHGHLAGDHYLQEAGATIRAQLRGADIPCRYGGDEFCLLLPQTGAEGARAIAERIRAAVAEQIVGVDGLALRTTVSIGLAVYPDHGTGELSELIRKADEALYRAKREGRDRVVLFAA